MWAVIMAGGKGTRVASVDSGIPKPLLPVNGIPVLQRQIECLKRQGITHIIIAIGHLGEQIQNFLGTGEAFGVEIRYIQEEVPLGTAGALFFLKNQICEDFFLINGDLIFDVDFSRLMAFHQVHGAEATLLVHPNDHPYDSGLVIADTDGCVRGWLTKEDDRKWYHNCVNTGIHVLAPRFLQRLSELKKTDLDRDLLKPMILSKTVFAYSSPEYVKDMGTPERIREVEQDLQTGLVKRRNLTQKQRAIFLDRDGTINRHVGFLRDIKDFVLLDDIAAAIRKINKSGYLAIVVTNQPVIARGEVTWEELDEIHKKMETLLGREGAYVDDIFVCPHHPDKGFPGERLEYKQVCSCRKPKPGLLYQAAEKYNIDLSNSWMIGDSPTDSAAGQAAGCQVIELHNGCNLLDAIDKIIWDNPPKCVDLE